MRKVIAMEDAGNTGKRAAETVAMAAAGTEVENAELEWGRRHMPPEPSGHPGRHEVIGLVILYKKPVGAGGQQQDYADSGEKPGSGNPAEFSGDLVFSMFERQERISGRLNNKIRRLEERLRAVEERGRG